MIDTITARELEALDIPEPKQIVDGFITVGLNILAGTPKSGKSFMALGVSLAIANGGKAFNKIPCQAADVLYLALEDNHFRLKHRLKILNQPTNSRLAFATASDRLSAGGIEDIVAYLAEHERVGMVVIDTLARISDPKTSGNIYDEDAAMGSAIQGLAMAHQVAILVVHHTRKAASGDFLSMVSGTQGFTGAADTVMVLTRQRNETAAVLELTGRDVTEKKLDLQWYSPGGGWLARGYAYPGSPMHDQPPNTERAFRAKG